jgi:hypothetical protein
VIGRSGEPVTGSYVSRDENCTTRITGAAGESVTQLFSELENFYRCEPVLSPKQPCEPDITPDDRFEKKSWQRHHRNFWGNLVVDELREDISSARPESKSARSMKPLAIRWAHGSPRGMGEIS